MNKPFFILLCGLFAASTQAATLTGTIKTAEGEPMHGVMVRLTDDANGISESVYTNTDGVYKLVTRLEGTLKVILGCG